jgi:hypothetical protein
LADNVLKECTRGTGDCWYARFAARRSSAPRAAVCPAEKFEKAIRVTRKPRHKCTQLFAGKAHAAKLTYAPCFNKFCGYCLTLFQSFAILALEIVLANKRNYRIKLSTHEKNQFEFMCIGAGFGGWAFCGNVPGVGSIHPHQHK